MRYSQTVFSVTPSSPAASRQDQGRAAFIMIRASLSILSGNLIRSSDVPVRPDQVEWHSPHLQSRTPVRVLPQRLLLPEPQTRAIQKGIAIGRAGIERER